MGALSAILRSAEDGRLAFRCPGCDEFHVVSTAPRAPGPRWTWNGDTERPTFSPSILVRTIRKNLTPAEEDLYDHLMTQTGGRDMVLHDPRFSYVCHSFVVAGQIQFLADSTHHLAGQTVPIPPWDKKASHVDT
jgi:hypothetical protein